MGNLITQSPWAAISAAASGAKQPSHVAVAYLGQKGDELLPLAEGSTLVVDVSLSAVRAGITYPGALLKIRKRGVRVFTAPLLHAKVFAFDGVGFVGSTNVSMRSRDHLREAVVRVADAPTLADIRNYVNGLATDELSKVDLEWLGKQYSPPSFAMPEVLISAEN
jgi:phosphatidylserine/phosphatidylglycerophosphate/cardiolipin synthase-like enzyme